MTSQNENQKNSTKPVGIILLSLYFAIVNGLLFVYVGFSLFGVAYTASTALIGVLLLVLGVFSLATSYGIWYTIEWARKYGIVICVISIPLNFYSPGEATAATVVLILSGIAVNVLVIWYLLKNDVKLLFSEANV